MFVGLPSISKIIIEVLYEGTMITYSTIFLLPYIYIYLTG